MAAIPRMQLDPTRDQYCVFGNPVAHSLSPRIHRLFAEQTGESLDYQAILAPENGFAETLKAFRDQGGRGANVTLPFKYQAWQIADRRSTCAERAGAVNTIWFDDSGLVHADNTDGVGLVRDLRDNLGVSLRGQSLLVLGAGGAVAGIMDPLFDEQPAQVVIANRTPDKARAIASRFADRGSIEAVEYADLAGSHFAIIINGTSLSLQDELPPLPEDILAASGFVYDMMYQSQPTCFMRWALDRGAAVAADGLGMLVEQAAEAFHIWRGIRPRTAPVIKQLRDGRA